MLEEGTYLFLVVPHLQRRFGTSVFFQSFFITVVIHSWLADLQPWLTQWSASHSVDSQVAFSYYFFLLFLLPQKLASLLFLTSTLCRPLNHITLSFTYICTHTLTCTYIYTHTLVCKYIYTHTLTCLYIYIYIYTHKCTCTFTYIYTHTLTFTYIYTHTLTFTSIYIHKHWDTDVYTLYLLLQNGRMLVHVNIFFHKIFLYLSPDLLKHKKKEWSWNPWSDKNDKCPRGMIKQDLLANGEMTLKYTGGQMTLKYTGGQINIKTNHSVVW